MLIKMVLLMSVVHEDLSNAGCKSNWSEVLWIGMVVSGLGLRDQLDDSLLPSLGNYPFT